MSRDMSYDAVMSRKTEIVKASAGIDFDQFESGSVAFDYERMLKSTGYDFDSVKRIQREVGVGNTPMLELRNLTALARKIAGPGKGARIFVKDEACNPSGSFKDRRAAMAAYHAKKAGYPGVLAATSGNFGAAVASQAAMRGLKCIIVQETYDSRKVGQPEIIEKARKCEAYGAEVVQTTVGPELFYQSLSLLESTGYFSASLYSPFGIIGVETLGTEVSEQIMALTGKQPDAVVITNAGGGNVTGTARGLRRAGCKAAVIGASVNLKGLHMASDTAFNKKSFTTGHTGFGIPFVTNPDRSDVPRSAARPLRYLDRYVTVNQGEVFYMTELLATLEGMERGPAGNTSLAAAFAIAQEMNEDQILVVQETEYTGAGKHVQPQLSFARDNGIDIHFGNPADEVPGESIILPESPASMRVDELNLDHMRKSFIKGAIDGHDKLTDEDIEYLAAETGSTVEFVKQNI
ncbi:PLP-dependent lyase/thiolase [Ruminococcaceae bacterium OttesenSCG-928-D13]|nr:PLP-dependent lyase/thiolase [Ruminococcaceae bacterium OttesenSCG-928-D13]